MQKRSTIIIAIVTALLVMGLAEFLNVTILRHLADNLTAQYIQEEGQVADRVVGNLENEMGGVEDKLKLIADIPEVADGNVASCTAKLDQVFAVLQARLGNLGRIGANGLFTCSVNRALVGVPGSKLGSYVTDIFQDPAHAPVLSHVILPPGGTYAEAMHVPVFGGTHQFEGTVGGAVYLRDLQAKFLKNVTFGQGGFAFLLDDNGDILYHPEADLIGGNISGSVAAKHFSNIVGFRAAVAEAKAGHSGTLRYALDGTDKVATYRPATILPGRRWVVFVSVPVAGAARALQSWGVNQAFWSLTLVLMLAIIAVAMTLVIGTLRAIRLQESLREEKAKAQTMLSSIGDGVMAIDREGRIVVFNAAAAEITGWEAKAAVGQAWHKVMRLIRERDRREDSTFVETAMSEGKLQHMEANTLLVRRDGSEIPVGDSAAPIFDAGRGVTGAIIVFRDLTQEREAARMKSDFAYASHQFRTPLTQAMTALSLAEGEKDGAQLKEDLAMAQVGLASAHRLALKLLAMADVDNGRVEAKLAKVDIGALVKGVVADVGENAPKSVAIKTKLAKGLTAVRTDAELVRQILLELLYNGLDYGDGKAVDMEIGVKDEALVIAVRNGGVSISDEDQAQVFAKFFRGANRPAEVAGAGLGLYLVREYVKLLGGKVWFESDAKGTVFWVSLPL